jgi:hypothetical protein
MTNRARQQLPNRRASETFTLECAGLQYIALDMLAAQS